MNNQINCAYCRKRKTEDGYENKDEYGLWFCSFDCDTKHKLALYYY